MSTSYGGGHSENSISLFMIKLYVIMPTIFANGDENVRMYGYFVSLLSCKSGAKLQINIETAKFYSIYF